MKSKVANPAEAARHSRRRAIILGLAVPLAISLLVHAGLGVFLKAYEWLQTPRQLTDSPNETVLAFAELLPPLETPPAPTTTPEHPPPPPLPEPVVESPPIRAPELPNPAPPPPRPIAASPPPTPPPIAPTPPAPRSAVFAGVKGDRADRVVYVVDASGPMASSLAFVLDELARSIDKLENSQLFQVVLFRAPPGTGAESTGFETFIPDSGNSGLIPASRRNKDAVRAWLRTVPAAGKSVPLSGLRAALGLKPDLVFLLTRSIPRSGPGASSDSEWGAGRAAVLATLEQLNPPDSAGKRPVAIKTIQFLDDDPSGLLKAIASIHGDGPGAYTIVKLDALRQR